LVHTLREEALVPDLPTIAHVTLTVSDLERSIQWYERLFDVEFHRDESPGPFRRAVWIVEGQTLVGLHEFLDSSDTLPFNERRIGLDHLAFACRSRDELEAWALRLSELGIDNGGIVDAGYGSGLSCRDPDNIALEFFAAAL
jgi:glyoxylase I family protein